PSGRACAASSPVLQPHQRFRVGGPSDGDALSSGPLAGHLRGGRRRLGMLVLRRQGPLGWSCSLARERFPCLTQRGNRRDVPLATQEGDVYACVEVGVVSL